jgi:O-antigen/teichoic acid export membrane protein
MNLKTKTVQGVGWSGATQALRVLFQFVITAILAHLLRPVDFGLIAMVLVFTNLVTSFSDFGLTAALIQRKEITEEHLSSSFWMNVLAGLFLALMLSALAPAIAFFYKEGNLTPIIVTIASTFFISSFGIVQTALLTKELKFKALGIIEVSGVAISGIAAVILALVGFGVWSLVWQIVISSVITVILLWFLCSWRPKLLVRWQRFKELLSYGLNLIGFQFVNYFSRNLDNLLIGRFLGAVSLGFYNLAYRILLFPINNISAVIGRVMFPSLSVIQDDKNKVRLAYMRATRYIAAVSFPMMMGLLVVAPQFIRVIFGPQWERSIFLVQVFAVLGLGQSVGSSVGWIYQSQGRTDILFRWGIFSTIVTVTAFIVGLHWNAEGVAVAYATSSYLIAYPSFFIPFKLINLKVSRFVRQFDTIFLATIGMAAATFALRVYLERTGWASDLISLILLVALGIACYVSLLFIVDRKLFKEVFQLLKHLRQAPLAADSSEPS